MEALLAVGRSVCEIISEWSTTAPHSIAAKSGNQTLSYEELNLQADRLANYLVQRGVASGSSVGLCLERSFDWIIAALAVMRAGAAYVPLDSVWPDSRLNFALKDSGAIAVLATTQVLSRLDTKAHGIDLSRDAKAISQAPKWQPRTIPPESLAYVIYTSGSTGTPKGVEITHANLSHLIRWHQSAFGITRDDRASHLAGLGFDAAGWEIWPHLSAGATVCLADDGVRSSPELIQEWMIREQVTIGFVPTVHAASMLSMKWQATTHLRFLLTGGDTLHRAPPDRLPFAVVNNYGPTECTVVATSSVLKPGSHGAPPIGRPIAGTTIYLLDENGNQVRDGDIGEIYVGGAGVGRGYRNLPDSTQRSFVPDRFSGVEGACMYRTGDRGVRRADGEIEFRGRLDRQTKIRGYRIELDEISAVLSQYPGVGFAAAIVDASEPEENQLVAYVLPVGDAAVPTVEGLQEHLQLSVPHYMIPSIFVRLSALPLSPNGKIDLKMLPKLAGSSLLEREVVVAAATPVEEQLLILVQDLLKSDAITAKDNFFLAGGHSLLGMQLIMRVRSEFGVEMTLRQLFESPTVEHLALLIEARLAQDRLTAIWKDILGVNQIELESNFFELGGDEASIAKLQRRIVSEFGCHLKKVELTQNPTVRQQAELMHGNVRAKLELPPGVVALRNRGAGDSLFWLHYACPNLVRAMGDDRPFLFVTLTDEDLDSLGAEPTLKAIAACFLPKILATKSEGPYVLGGFCLGGIISYEVACQMRASGHEVSLLVLLDTPSPKYYGSPLKSLAFIGRPHYLVTRIRQLGLRKSFDRLVEYVAARLPNAPERKPNQPEKDSVQLMIEDAAARYKPGAYDGKVSLIMASGQPPQIDLPSWWRSLVPQNLKTHHVDADHIGLVEVPAVYDVAALITSHLKDATGELCSANAFLGQEAIDEDRSVPGGERTCEPCGAGSLNRSN